MVMNRELRVVRVTNKPDEYPDFVAASAEFPELVECIEDEAAAFVVDSETGEFWPVAEFFFMCDVTAFLVNPAELA